MTQERNKLEYVGSGLAHTRITLLDAKEEDIAPYLRAIVTKAEDKLKTHNITGLYNAFAEPSNGRNLFEGKFFKTPLHADSGGLQIITRGLDTTPEVKRKVYESQAKYSGVAMCFDEIPATQEKNASLRLFKDDLVEEKARQTALNVVEQAKAFEEIGTDAKIFLIIQGNDLDSYHRWADTCVKTIPEDLHHWIGGIAMAGTTSGMGDREDVERFYSFTSLPVPDIWKDRLHLLGIGAASRMLSITGLIHSGLMPENCLISYDSTSHSSCMTFRKYVNKDSTIYDFGHDRTKTMEIYNFTKNYFQIQSDEDEYYDIVNYSRDDFIAKYSRDNLYRYHETMFATFMVSAYHCMAMVEKQLKSKEKYKSFCQGKQRSLAHLTEVSSYEDYIHYMNQVGSDLSSKKVQKEGGFSNLGGFFGDD